MVRDVAIDLADFPELARLVDEVRNSGRRRLLRRDGENIAVLAPLPASRSRGAARRPDHTALALAVVERTAGIFRDAAGRAPATLEHERDAFEQGVADEVVHGPEA